MNLRRDVFQAIADPTRRAILLLVATQSMSAGSIAANFDTARPTVSKHLQILTECELLEYEQSGREISCPFPSLRPCTRQPALMIATDHLLYCIYNYEH